MLPELTGQLKTVVWNDPASLKDQLRPILANANLFGSDLYEAGLGARIEDMVRSMLAGPGSVRKTLHSCLF